MVSLHRVQELPIAKAFLKQADDNFMAIGYKEQGFRHANYMFSDGILRNLPFSGPFCRRAARYLVYNFVLFINKVRFL